MLRALAKSVLRKIPPRNFRALSRMTVFYMHGLVRDHADRRVQCLHLKLDDFRQTLVALKSWVRFVSVEEALSLMAAGDTQRPVAVLTSDDGYVDNHDLLLPLTQDLGVPLALFVSTGHIETGARFPTYLARCFAYYTAPGAYALPGVDTPVLIASGASRAAASNALSAALYRLPQEGVRKLCAAMTETLGAERQAELDAKFDSDRPMSWAQVKAMRDAGVEIGAHCHEHALLHRGQPREEVERQIITSKTLLEDRLGRCRYFAYPVGNTAHIGPAAVRAVRDAGFDAAFSTISGTLAASRDDFLLPRVMLNPDGQADVTRFPFTALLNDRALPAKQATIIA